MEVKENRMKNRQPSVIFLLPEIKGGGAEKAAINLYQAMNKYSAYPCYFLSLGNIHVKEERQKEYREWER